jgi:CRISPR-associated protein Cas2
MLEVRAGVYVGTMSPRVRERLWTMTCKRVRTGSCLLVHSARTEQGFAIRAHGDNSRTIFDIDGLLLVRRT